MADIDFNPEKNAGIQAVSHSFSPMQTEGYANDSGAFKIADSITPVRFLPVYIVCPDGTFAGKAHTKQDAVKLNLQCKEQG